MYIVLIILTLICALLLICVVLVQKSKGGGLSSSFAGSNRIMGVRRTNSFIEKLTGASPEPSASSPFLQHSQCRKPSMLLLHV